MHTNVNHQIDVDYEILMDTDRFHGKNFKIVAIIIAFHRLVGFRTKIFITFHMSIHITLTN